MTVGGPAARRRWHILLVVGAVLTPFNYILTVPIGAATLHPLHVWGVIAILMAVLTDREHLWQGFDTPTLLLWTMFVFVLSSTVFGTSSVYKVRGFLDVALLAINLLVFTVLRGQLTEPDTRWPFMRALFLASLVSSGLLALRAMLLAQTGVFESPDSYILGLGTVTGTFTAALTAAAIVGITFARGALSRVVFGMGVALHGLAASLALARGPWLAMAGAVVAGFAWTAWWARRRSSLIPRMGWLFASVVVLVVTVGLAVAFSQNVRLLLVPRLLQTANIASGTGQSRLSLYREIFWDALNSPFFGQGASSYRRVSELLGKQGSISENFVLEMFHAGGLAAALPLVTALLLILWCVARSVRTTADPAIAASCLSGLMALGLGALTNPAAWDSAFWVFLAVGAATEPQTLGESVSPGRGVPEGAIRDPV